MATSRRKSSLARRRTLRQTHPSQARRPALFADQDSDSAHSEGEFGADHADLVPVALPVTTARGSQTGRPTMALLDLLGRRWTLRIIWELRSNGVRTFRELQSRCDDASSSVLIERLHELRAAGIVVYREGGGYRLTDDGQQLLGMLGPLQTWAEAWAVRLAISEYTPGTP